MRVWRLWFRGHYPECSYDFLGENLVDAVALAKKYFAKSGNSGIDTVKDLVDVILLSAKIIREDELK